MAHLENHRRRGVSNHALVVQAQSEGVRTQFLKRTYYDDVAKRARRERAGLTQRFGKMFGIRG